MKEIQQKVRSEALRHVAFQGWVALAAALPALLLFGFHTSMTLLLGALVCILPNTYFAWRISRKTGALQAKNILSDIYRGEFIKLILTGAMFWLIFTFIPVTITPIFSGFLIAQVAFWVSLSLMRSKRTVE